MKSSDWERNVPSLGDWESIARQKANLEEQEEEAMAKILRLRKQRKLLVRREAEMSRRGLKFLDELDAAENKERVEEEKREAERQQLTATSAAFGDFLLPEDPADPFWATLGSAGETAGSSQGS